MPIKLYLRKQIVAFIWPGRVPLLTDLCSGLHGLPVWQCSVTLLLIPRVRVLGGGDWCEVIRSCRLHPHKWINVVTMKVSLLSWGVKLLWKDKFVGAWSLSPSHLSYPPWDNVAKRPSEVPASPSRASQPPEHKPINSCSLQTSQSVSSTLLEQCADWDRR